MRGGCWHVACMLWPEGLVLPESKGGEGTCESCTSKVHERPGVLSREPQDIAGLEVAVHPATGVQLRQPLCNEAQSLHACIAIQYKVIA